MTKKVWSKEVEDFQAQVRVAMFWEGVIGWGNLVGKIVMFYIMIHFALKYW